MVRLDFSCFHIVFTAIKTTTFLISTLSGALSASRRHASVKLVYAWVVCTAHTPNYNQIKSNYFVLFSNEMWHEHHRTNMQHTVCTTRTKKQTLCDEEKRKRLETNIENQRLVESRHYYILKWRAEIGVCISIESWKSVWNEVSHGCEKV